MTREQRKMMELRAKDKWLREQLGYLRSDGTVPDWARRPHPESSNTDGMSSP